VTEPALCFRCDWAGDTRQRECPRCGAPLYREARERRPARLGSRVGGRTERGRTAPEAPSAAGPAEAPGPLPAAPTRRNRPGAVLALVGGLTLLAVWVLVRPRDEPPPPPPAPPALSGRIVYVPQGGNRLQVLDLAEGTVDAGPALPGRLLSLTPDPALGDRLVAVVERSLTESEAFMVDLSRVAPEPEPIARAVLLAVSPDGGAVVAGAAPGEDGSCPIVSMPVGRSEAREVGRVSRCRLVFALEASRDEIFFTLLEGGPTIHRLEPDGSDPILQGYVLLSVSPAGDLLASPTEERREAVLVSETVLYRPGRGIVDVRRGPDGLATEEVLAWSADGRLVAVLGWVGAEPGVWVIDTAAPSDPRVPVPVGPRTSTSRISAAFAGEDLLFVAIEGQLYVDSGDRTDPVTMPGDAAPPGGPMAWLP
jgi:hypothetical protein